MKKICIVTSSLGKGGAERFSGILSQMLSKLQFKVYIILTKNNVDYEFSGKLFNLELEYGNNISNIKKLKILRSYFKAHDFDAIIDNRTRPSFLKEYVLYNYVFKARKIISIVHSYCLKNYLTRSVFFARILYTKIRIIAVSKEIEEAIITKYKLKDCKQIYNPAATELITKKVNENIEITDEFVLWYGRIDENVKNISLLLQAYKKSSLPNKGIKLYIIGDGKDVDLVKKRIKELQLEGHINHISYLKNPFPYVSKALFTVLTSRYEGFPMVLVESLVCGTPVVSVDCKSGPKEIIQDGYNGLLVENHDVLALSNAFDSFIINKLLYKMCKVNAKASINKFSIDYVAKQWDELLK